MALVDIKNGVMSIRYDPAIPVTDGQHLRNMIQDERDWASDAVTEIRIVDPIPLTGSAEGLFADMPSVYTISGLDRLRMSRVTSVKGMFENDIRLSNLCGDVMNPRGMSGQELAMKSITSPRDLRVMNLRNTPCLKDVSHMFQGCSSLRSIRITGDDCSPIETMEGMFEGCSSLENVDIKSIDTSDVTDMSKMFKDCKQIKALTLDWQTPNISGNRTALDASGVRDLSEMFSGCQRLRALFAQGTIWPDASTTDHRDMFKGCVSLIGVRVSPSMQPLLEAHGLTDEVLAARREDMATVTHREGYVLVIGDPDRDFEIAASVLADRISETREADRLSDIYEVRIVGNVRLKGDASDLFSRLERATAINGLDMLDTSQVTNMHRMFASCGSLRTINVGCLDTSNVTDMSEMFCDCTNLEEIGLDGIDTHAVKTMDYMFGWCRALQSLDASQLDMSSVESVAGMFNQCSSLTELDISSWNAPYLDDKEYMFNFCTNLERIETAGMSADAMGAGKTDSMFAFCEKLKSLDLSGFGITRHDLLLMPSALSGCKLENVTFSNEPYKPTHDTANRTPIAVEDKFDTEPTVDVPHQSTQFGA